MLSDRKHFLLWKRQVFVRNPNDELNALFSGFFRTSGIYLIGCADEIVYVGQSWNLRQSPLESLGRVYHQVHDTSLAWSLALAPCPPVEMDELESTAIGAYAPKFNTSIPSIPKSEGAEDWRVEQKRTQIQADPLASSDQRARFPNGLRKI